MNISLYYIFISIIGFLLCFAGWRLFRISAKIIGFILGAIIGYTIVVFVREVIDISINPSWAPWIPFFSAILLGLLGIILIQAIIKSILFIAGLLFGIVIFSIYSGFTRGSANPFEIEIIITHISVWSIASGVIFGILFILFEKWFVIIYTSTFGAYLVMIQLDAPVLVFYIMAVAGVFLQLWMSKGSRMKDLRIAKADIGD